MRERKSFSQTRQQQSALKTKLRAVSHCHLACLPKYERTTRHHKLFCSSGAFWRSRRLPFTPSSSVSIWYSSMSQLFFKVYKKIRSILGCVKKMWKGTLFKRRTPGNITNCSESFSRVQTANYKFSEKIKHLKP